MNEDTVKLLLDLNRQFYQTFALQFSATRMRLQPGVQRILSNALPENANILDLGCGNGELARQLSHGGFRVRYTGLDFSHELLEIAQSRSGQYHFLQADLSEAGWAAALPAASFDLVLAFAVLHHLPGSTTRRRVLEQTHALLLPGGRFIHSEWQFLNSPRLRARIQPWERIGLTSWDVEPGDALLDWRQGGYGLRYVHHFQEGELNSLASETGFAIRESFLSDGEGGNLSLYQIWETRAA